MEVRIHPQALISPKAKIGQDVQIGPFCVIEDNVVIGDGCCLESRVTIHRDTVLGTDNHLFEGATIGGLPQCVGIGDKCGSVVIGNGNMIRENVTVHRAMNEDDATEIGDNCMFMVNAHIAHDCRVADNVIMANNTMLAGHVSVGRRAFISGAVGVHQFCRIGAFAMVGGQSHIVKDIPPFLLVDGLTSEIVGLNNVGLRRAGCFTPENINDIKSIYRILYLSGLPWREIVNSVQHDFKSGPGLEMANFLSTTTRGITAARHTPRHPAIAIPEEERAIHLHVVTEEEESAAATPYRRRVVG